MKKICAIKKCTGSAIKRGMCSTHWKRWGIGIYTIEIDSSRRRKGSFDEKMQSFTKFINGCIEWTGPLSNSGYGRMFYKGKRLLAHRAVFIETYGKIPEGKDVHHKCGNRKCVNIKHLEPLSKFFHLKELKRDSLGRLLPYSKT